MNIKQVTEAIALAAEQNAIHHKAQVLPVSEFKKHSGLTVGNMAGIQYANPNKMNIRAHAGKVAMLTCKFVMFYTYNGMHKVMQAGSLEAIAGYVEMRVRQHANDMAIIGE